MSEAKAICVYGLGPVSIERIDLRTCYAFFPPNRAMDDLFPNDRLMPSSPHAEICGLYIKHGADGLRQCYKETRYWAMLRRMGKSGFPKKVIDICESIRDGYLREEYEGSHVVVLKEPFAASRYLRTVPERTPEIWSGHHRTGALLAFGVNVVDVLVARDARSGTKHSAGKVHGLCLEDGDGR